MLSDLSSAPSINYAGRMPPAVAESATNLSDRADQHISQYRESDSATSINTSTGMHADLYMSYSHYFFFFCTVSAQCDKNESKDFNRDIFNPYIGMYTL